VCQEKEENIYLPQGRHLCTSQRNQKSELIETARQFTYTHQHPHSRVTNQGRRAAAARTGTGETEAGANWRRRSRKSQHVDTKGGNSNFYNKLRKPGLELETLGSDTMLGIDKLYSIRAKGHIYSICTGVQICRKTP
jgi:hypothetical protein